MWSRWQPERNMPFNSYFIETSGGNLIVDPLALEVADAERIAAAGGAAWVIVTNRDHERDARAVADRFGAKVAASAADAGSMSLSIDRKLDDGDSIGGMNVVALRGLKTAGEIALHSSAHQAIFVGDALLGNPAGALRLMPDEKLIDAVAAVRSLRALRALRPRHVLVGDGAPVFGYAWEVLNAFFESRTEAYANVVNLDELHLAKRDRPEPFQTRWAEVGYLLGAEKLGYAVTRIEPGMSLCPLHWHVAEEELFIVWEGTPTLRSRHGSRKLRPGDIACFPPSEYGAHALWNYGDEPATIFLIATTDSADVCMYPDSKKLAVRKLSAIVRSEPLLDYFDGEV